MLRCISHVKQLPRNIHFNQLSKTPLDLAQFAGVLDAWRAWASVELKTFRASCRACVFAVSAWEQTMLKLH